MPSGVLAHGAGGNSRPGVNREKAKLEEATMKALLEDLLCRYLKRHHGLGQIHQDVFYRCRRCSRLVTWKIIEKGGCSCSGSAPMMPANPTFSEWLRLIFMPWSVS